MIDCARYRFPFQRGIFQGERSQRKKSKVQIDSARSSETLQTNVHHGKPAGWMPLVWAPRWWGDRSATHCCEEQPRRWKHPVVVRYLVVSFLGGIIDKIVVEKKNEKKSSKIRGRVSPWPTAQVVCWLRRGAVCCFADPGCLSQQAAKAAPSSCATLRAWH